MTSGVLGKLGNSLFYKKRRYHGLEDGNTDLNTHRASANDFAGVQPSIGDSVSRYQGWAEGNPDLFKANGTQERPSTGRPDIYMNVSGNPDLHF